MTGYAEKVMPVEILLVEDNPADVRLIAETLKDFQDRNNMAIVKDGVDAMEYLKKSGKFPDAVRPDIIILDLNLPKKNGFEILKEIKEDAALRNIPVVVLSTSDSHKDVATAYGLQASCFITKPVGLDDFIKTVKQIENFWISVVKLPEK